MKNEKNTNTQTKTKKSYRQEVDTLRLCLNNRLNKKVVLRFGNSLRSLKQNYKTELSTMFLRNLVNRSDRHERTRIVHKILKRNELELSPRYNYVTEYNNKGRIKSRQLLSFVLV